jgi:hypothetical protein
VRENAHRFGLRSPDGAARQLKALGGWATAGGMAAAVGDSACSRCRLLCCACRESSGRSRHRRPGVLAATRRRAWPADHLALLGLHRDDRVAALTGRGANAVRVKRCKLGIPNPSGPGWTEEELALLGTAPDAEVAAEIGHTEGAVTLKRCRLGIPTFCDRRRGNR